MMERILFCLLPAFLCLVFAFLFCSVVLQMICAQELVSTVQKCKLEPNSIISATNWHFCTLQTTSFQVSWIFRSMYWLAIIFFSCSILSGCWLNCCLKQKRNGWHTVAEKFHLREKNSVRGGLHTNIITKQNTMPRTGRSSALQGVTRDTSWWGCKQTTTHVRQSF